MAKSTLLLIKIIHEHLPEQLNTKHINDYQVQILSAKEQETQNKL